MRFGKADGQSIMAMRLARMSPESIAATLGGRWTARKVLAAVEALQEADDQAAGGSAAPGEAAEAPPIAHGVRPADGLRQQGQAAGLTVLPPIGPRKLRFMRWFADARWSLKDIGWLFDEDPEDVALAAHG